MPRTVSGWTKQHKPPAQAIERTNSESEREKRRHGPNADV